MANKFKVGDKVKIPTQKTNSISLEDCSVMNHIPYGQDYLFITRVDGSSYVLGKTIKGLNSSFNECDLELYNDENNYEIY